MQRLAEDVIGASYHVGAGADNQRVGAVDGMKVLAGIGSFGQEVLPAIESGSLLVV